MKAMKYLFIIAASAFIFNACTKDVAGPTGPTGPQGPQGASSSYNVTIDSSEVTGSWVPDLSAPVSTFNFTINNVNGLTNPGNSIVDVYYATSLNKLSAQYYVLPCGNTLQSMDWFQYYYAISSVTVQYVFSSPPSQKLYFKVVVITQP